MNTFVQFVGAFATGNVRAASEFLATEATPLPQEYIPLFEAIRVVQPECGERLLEAAAKSESPQGLGDLLSRYSWLPNRRFESGRKILLESGGPTAAFFDSPAHAVEKARRTLCGALNVDVDATPAKADLVENLVLEKMARFDKLSRQQTKVLQPGENPNLFLRNRGPLAVWFKGQEEDIIRSLLPLAPEAIEILIRFIRDGAVFATYALEFAFLLAQKNPRTIEEVARYFHGIPSFEVDSPIQWGTCFFESLLRLYSVDPWKGLVILDHLYRMYPEEASSFDKFQQENFVHIETLNIQPRRGRNHLLIAAVSDLHHSPCNANDVEKVAARVREIDPDILIIAGDVANEHEYFSRALDLFRGAWKTLVVAGNHDVWSAHEGGGPTSEELWEEVLPRLTREAGAIWLEGTPVLVGDSAIVGTFGGYDYSGDRTGRSQEELAVKKHIQDATRIDWSWNDQEFAMTRRHRLKVVLDAVSARPEVKRILVVTHMPPFNELISNVEREYEGDFFDRRSAYYFTPTLGEMIASFPKVQYTVSGHTHQGQTAIIPREGMQPIRARVIAESLPDDSLNEIAVYKI